MSTKRGRSQRRASEESLDSVRGWVGRELQSRRLEDVRLGRRLHQLVEQMASSPGQSIPFACQDWANTKAAYRFLDNDRSHEAEVLEGHFQSSRERAARTSGPILVLHDTTEFSYKRDDIEPIGKTHVGVAGVNRDGRPRLYTACGILMHSSLAITTNGLPLGLVSTKFWSRKTFKGTNALKRSVNPTRVPIEQKESVRWLENLKQSTARLGEPERCVHIGDRESDIYELFCAAKDAGTHFLVRACVDRLAGDGGHTIQAEMDETRCKGLHRVEVRDQRGRVSLAVVELKYRQIRVLPPIGKQRRYPELSLTVLHATERSPPKGRDPIDWKLITDLPIASRTDALEKLRWYALRWKIEVFHKILKSGCRAEDAKLRTAERLVLLLAILCILGWRIFWMTMLQRTAEVVSPTLAFTPVEIELLNRSNRGNAGRRSSGRVSIHSCLVQLAKLGGYLNRASDAPPGNMVMWRGLMRLNSIVVGYEMVRQDVGN
jgi:hypothetical protein